MLAHVRDIVLGRPTARGVTPIVVQLLLILLWHAAVLNLVLDPATYELLSAVEAGASRLWFAVGLTSSFITWAAPTEMPFSLDGLLGVLTVAVPLLFAGVTMEGALAGASFFVLAPQTRRSLSAFVRSWWRAWAWATLLLPGAAVVISALKPFYPPDWAVNVVMNVGLWGYILFAPAFLARREVRPRHRLTSWRPVCPECGYSLRRLHADRCPECGVAFPTKSRVFRRWAIQRLIWDRASRGSLVFAYVRTLLAVAFCPCRAARRLAIPDRYGRAGRWAVGHVALVACVGLTLGQDSYFLDWTLRQLGPDAAAFRSMPLGWGTPSAGRVAIWAGQTYTAWLVALVVLPLLGALLGIAMAWHHPVARRGIAKWSLYATAIHVPAAIVWYSLQFGVGRARSSAPLATLLAPPAESSVPSLLSFLAVAYGLWWAMGASANPYVRHRGFEAFVPHAAIFAGTWIGVTRVLFPPGQLEELL